jgi:hypothetical protein
MSTITDYRADLDELLATAVDNATWTDAIFDAALRRGLTLYDMRRVYEDDFTVTSAGHTQDLSGLADLNEVLALAYPWRDGAIFDQQAVRWRSVGDQTVVLAGYAPQVDEVIRVRYTRRHTVEGLDGATATTVPERHRLVVGLAAAAYACDLRRRQLSENPAQPASAVATLEQLAARFRADFFRYLHLIQPSDVVAWAAFGL